MVPAMNSIIRLLGLVNRTPPANPMAALEDLLDLLSDSGSAAADIVLLPRFALCPPSSGELMRSKTLLAACEEALNGLLLRSKELESFLVLTLPLQKNGIPYEAGAVIYKGELYCFSPDEGELPLFRVGDLSFTVLPCDPHRLPHYLPQVEDSGCDLVLVPSYEPVYAGSRRAAAKGMCALSAAASCAVAAVNGGVGDTSSPHLWGGYILVAEEGNLLAQKCAEQEGIALYHDFDCDLLRAARPAPQRQREALCAHPCTGAKAGLLREVSRTPYLPDKPGERERYLEELFTLQTRALACRLDNTGLERLVLGVSGGLDSTLALLCCARVCDLLGYPRQRILGVTMPGFGTTDRTYYNALLLMEQLGIETRDIPIRNAVSSHFEDIAHDPAKRDAVYENAQARERAQILFDLSNQENGLVVGTGDLSEAALGFSTFGGDHLAGYNVNICLNKTTIRELVALIAQRDWLPGVGETLQDILDTPVSPELLPGGGEGIVQRTEELVGPYELHDFFLYYVIRWGFAPQKVLRLACRAFKEKYPRETILRWLKEFYRRFFAQQFKRSCLPDAPKVGSVTLSPRGDWRMPSDASARLWLSQLENM